MASQAASPSLPSEVEVAEGSSVGVKKILFLVGQNKVCTKYFTRIIVL
jgi:hypothetical protein